MFHRFNLIRICIFGLQALSILATDYPKVILKQGPLSGLYEKSANGRRFSSFYGVPYAKPPVGQYRFQDAEPAEPWVGTFNASIKPSVCLQYDYFQYQTSNAVNGEEDCLYANVFSPKSYSHGSGDQLLNVIVFIHGGAFMFANGASFAPYFIMDKNVVLVTFNYRLGPLGFLSTEDEVIIGNYGMKDQVLLLKWVRDNIISFGGDPNRVTITGLSAGGSSVHYHMLSKKSKGLFRSAVAMSGTALNPWAQTEGAREKAFRLGSVLGCHVTESLQLLSCLRDRPARHIVYHSRIFMPWAYQPFSPFGPVIEKPGPNAFIDAQPIDIIRNGVPNDVPLLLSHTSHEGIYPGGEIVCNQTYFDRLNGDWFQVAPHLFDYNYTAEPVHLNEVSNAIWSRYMGDAEVVSVGGLIQAIGDRHFISGIVKTARLHAKSMLSPTYMYKFNYRGQNSLTSVYCGPKVNLGVSHGDDLSYILPSNLVAASQSLNDVQMTKSMVEMWTSFAIFGLEQWTEVKKNLPKISYFNINTPNVGYMEYLEDMNYLDFWNNLGLNENIPR
ncbi:hypothetical protein AAG570_000439 [Ranatra chinensis]|uniref:Carboxylic ester hydrolase n=1 Tax=Ranatra chinensis TaxID=642074 RepID=A0ABD0YZ71_9HEMI